MKDYQIKFLSKRLMIPKKKLVNLLSEIIPDSGQQLEFYETVELLVSSSNNTSKKKIIAVLSVITVIVIGFVIYILKFKI
jgi:uncharacterized membrane protein